MSVCFVVLVTQLKKRMRRIIIVSPVACPSVPYFSKFCHKRNDFQKKVMAHKMCFDFIYKFRRKHTLFKNNSSIYDHKCT